VSSGDVRRSWKALHPQNNGNSQRISVIHSDDEGVAIGCLM